MPKSISLPAEPVYPVLLVDDSSVYRQRTGRMLEQLGISCHVAGSGEDALAFLERQRVSLILMDLQMPDTDGYHLAQAIRRKGPNKDAPIIAISPDMDPETHRKVQQYGMNDFLSKPVKPEELLSVVNRWLFKGPAQLTIDDKHDAVSSEQEQESQEGFAALDVTLLREMFSKEEEETGYLKTFIQVFLEEVAKRIVSLKATLDAEDLSSARLEAHAVKGASLSVGAVRMAHQFEDLEKLIVQKRLQEAKKALPQAEAEYQTVLNELDRIAKGILRIYHI